jgi:hypothetical protein
MFRKDWLLRWYKVCVKIRLVTVENQRLITELKRKQELSLDIDICPRNVALKGNRYTFVTTTLLPCRFLSGENIIKTLLMIKCHSMFTNECYWCIFVVWCGVVWCGMVWDSIALYSIVYGGVGCGVVWCGVVWCGVVSCGVVWWSVVWYGLVW